MEVTTDAALVAPSPIDPASPRTWSGEQRVRLLAFDERALIWLRSRQHPHVTTLMREFTRLGDPRTYVSLCIVLGLASPQTRRIAALVGGAAIIGASVAQFLKRWAKRPRPHAGIKGFEGLVEIPDAFSFPSGHTATAVAVAVALMGEGSGLGPAAAVLAACIGASRVYLGAHYPLDVVVGAILGSGAGVATRMLLG